MELFLFFSFLIFMMFFKSRVLSVYEMFIKNFIEHNLSFPCNFLFIAGQKRKKGKA